VEFTRMDEFAVITLNRPEALNALSFSVVEEIDAAITKATASDARALLITGAGDKAFCAGADINELRSLSPVEFRQQLRRGQSLLARLSELPIPSFAVVNGLALGGGMELALACTFRVASPRARMGLPEIKLGAVPGYGGPQRLPRHVGLGRALDIVMSGRFVGADEALAIGLVTRVVDGDLMAGAMEYARTFTCYGLPSLRLAREAVMRAVDTPIDDGLKMEAELSALSFSTDDAKEGTGAFLEKRPPVFKDR
ncbi:MAG: enoyl-CoA hydratase/isomerase family protein, partial [Alphaproteobacteria bacterium]